MKAAETLYKKPRGVDTRRCCVTLVFYPQTSEVARMDVDIENVRKITSGIEDGISDAESELLYNLVRNVPDGEVIVEIGRGKGESTVWLAKGSVDGKMNKVYNVRSRSGKSEGIEADEDNTNAEFIANLEKAGVHTIVNYSYTDSEATSRRWRDKVGLLCINASCEYEDMKEIFRSWERHLSPNARVVVYGCDNPGPARIIKEYLGSLGDFTFEQRVGTLMAIRIDKCVHHWIIDASEIGICRYCGRTRNFKRIKREADTAGARRRQAPKTQNKEKQTNRKKKKRKE